MQQLSKILILIAVTCIGCVETQTPSAVVNIPDQQTGKSNADTHGEAQKVADVKVTLPELTYTGDSLAEIAGMVRDHRAVLLDVRSQEEWEKGHVDVAEFLSIDTIKDASQAEAVAAVLSKIEKGTPIYVHCYRGGRAMTCAEILAKTGHDVRPVQAKFEDFGGAGFNVVQ